MVSKSSPAPVKSSETEKPVSSVPVMIKKLSINKVYGNVLKIGEEVVLTGTVVKVTTETSQYGDYSKFSGMFYSAHNGVVVSAPVLYLPEIGEIMLASAFDKANGAPVDFHFAITRIEDKASKTGYTWGMVPKGETADASKRYVALLNG